MRLAWDGRIWSEQLPTWPRVQGWPDWVGRHCGVPQTPTNRLGQCGYQRLLVLFTEEFFLGKYTQGFLGGELSWQLWVKDVPRT